MRHERIRTIERAPLKFVTRKKEVKTYMVRAYHEGCGGELVGVERGVAVWPAAWKHKCAKCGETNMVIGANYPMIAFGDKKEGR